MRVLPGSRLRLEEGAELVAVGLRCDFPISADRVPAFAQTFLVGIAVLRNNRGYAFWVFHRNPQAHRRAVIEDVDSEPVQPDDLGETIDYISKISKPYCNTSRAGRSDRSKPG